MQTQTSTSESSLAEYRIRVQRVIDHITAHLAEDLTLDSLARAACFSSFHFHRIFSLMLGETPAGFVNRLRLERAANLIVMTPSVPITEIAYACGFSSSAVFSRSFKKYFGVSATRWRDKSKNSKLDGKIGKASVPDAVYIEDVQHSLHHAHSERNITMDIRITQLPAYRIAYAANLEGYSKEKIGAAWNTICAWAGAHGLFGPDTKTIGVSFDNPDITPKEKCRYYACITVGNEVMPPPPIGVMTLRAGTYAVARFEGNETDISAAYRDLYGRWLPTSGYVPADAPCYEIYLSNAEQHARGNFVMDICLPIIPL
ncbi:MAG TPA: AraC family transcriptional regulator [Bacteroidota bacterium]|nr:AraC family transcriptional regulator [Bacteroidota bacterium]